MAAGVTLCIVLGAALVVGLAARVRPDPTPAGHAAPSPTPPTPPPSPAKTQARGPSPSPPAVQLSPAAVLAFPSATQGWVVSGGQILATVNGGRSFTVQVAAGTKVRTLDFVSPAVGWAVSAGGLLATTDSGQRWATVGAPPQPLGQVSFWDSKDGLGLATDNSLWRSADGGQTWTPVTPGVPAEAVCGASPTAALVVAAASVYHSDDGGATWSPVYHLPGGPPAGAGSSVSCTGSAAWVDLRVVVASGGVGQVVVRSLDGGATWVPVAGAGAALPGVTPLHPSLFIVPGPLGLAAPGAAFFSGTAASGLAIAATTDGGTTLAAAPIASRTLQISAVADLMFADPRHGWALATSGRSASLLQTTNGGAHWGQVAILPG